MRITLDTCSNERVLIDHWYALIINFFVDIQNQVVEIKMSTSTGQGIVHLIDKNEFVVC